MEAHLVALNVSSAFDAAGDVVLHDNVVLKTSCYHRRLHPRAESFHLELLFLWLLSSPVIISF